MLSPQTLLRPNYPDVSDEIFDDEVMLLNTRTGHYFSVTGTGAAVWKAVCEGFSLEAIVEGMARSHPQENRAGLETAAADFAEKLLEGHLVVVAESKAKDGFPAFETGAFVAPLLQKFTDMEELLLIDPVHEVDERGWPHFAPPENEEKGAGHE